MNGLEDGEDCHLGLYVFLYSSLTNLPTLVFTGLFICKVKKKFPVFYFVVQEAF